MKPEKHKKEDLVKALKKADDDMMMHLIKAPKYLVYMHLHEVCLSSLFIFKGMAIYDSHGYSKKYLSDYNNLYEVQRHFWPVEYNDVNVKYFNKATSGRKECHPFILTYNNGYKFFLNYKNFFELEPKKASEHEDRLIEFENKIEIYRNLIKSK